MRREAPYLAKAVRLLVDKMARWEGNWQRSRGALRTACALFSNRLCLLSERTARKEENKNSCGPFPLHYESSCLVLCTYPGAAQSRLAQSRPAPSPPAPAAPHRTALSKNLIPSKMMNHKSYFTATFRNGRAIGRLCGAN